MNNGEDRWMIIGLSDRNREKERGEEKTRVTNNYHRQITDEKNIGCPVIFSLGRICFLFFLTTMMMIKLMSCSKVWKQDWHLWSMPIKLSSLIRWSRASMCFVLHLNAMIFDSSMIHFNISMVTDLRRTVAWLPLSSSSYSSTLFISVFDRPSNVIQS